MASIPLLFSLTSRIKYLPQAFLIWCSGYIFISLLWFWLFSSPSSEFQELRNRILSVLFILIMTLIFSKSYLVLIWTRYAILVAGLLAVFNNIYEFFNPLVFSALNDTGRPAGFYVNPNTSGCALVLSMICSVSILQQRYRLPFVSTIGIGIFLTFSRGAILCWFVAVMILIITHVIPRYQLFYWGVALGVIIGLAQIGGNVFNLDKFQEMGLLNQNVLERLREAGNTSGVEDDSARSRFEVVQLAWEMFVEHPLIGNGIGSTHQLNVGGLATHDISTHNMYLYFMTDHGILGILIFPLLVYAVIRHTQGEMKYISWAFAAFILLWGLFSHNIVDQRPILLSFSLMATMNEKTQLDKKLKNKL
ncbi:MAG: O-antigen ligase family protein [Rhizonema sp. PD38]|nr:O-antigen ligase family protein [Rhizonema sp. PD38]